MKLVEIGAITKPHGIRGEVKIRLHWAGSDALSRISEVVIARDGQEQTLELQAVRGGGKVGLIARLSGVVSREDADALRGATVSVRRELLPPLEPGEYYLSDLVGARVVGPDGPIGIVEEIALHPSVDALVIRTEGAKVLEQPIDDAWVDSVDVEAGIVRLSTTEGLV